MREILPFYFKLQVNRFKRWCSDLKMMPFVLILLGLIFFYGGSAFLFYRSPLAKWFYPLLGLFFSFQMNSLSHLHTLKGIFSKRDYRMLKIAQSYSFVLPFAIYLFIEMLPLQAVALMILSIFLGLTDQSSSISVKIPTPFYQRPFEFVVGFRKTYIFIALLYFLVFKGIQVGNANLAYASMGFIFLLIVSFYSYPENEIFVWINDSDPPNFIQKKIKVACLYSSLLVSPVLLACLIAFPTYYLAAIFIFLLGFLLLILIILAKYSSFPHDVSLPQAIILALSFMFPPLLIYTLPSFYKKALKNLEPILQC